MAEIKKINTDLQIEARLLDGNGSAGTSGQILSSTGTATDWISLSEISGVDGTGTANYVAKWSDPDTITNSVIYDDGTNVGIGTASPGEKLDVVGRVRGERFRTTTGGDASFAAYYFSGDSDTGTFQPANNMLGITTAGTERMRITDAGNVGIGTTSPGYALSVNGDVQSDFFRSYQYPTSSFLDFDDDTTPGSNGTALVSVSSMKFIADSNNNATTDAFSWIVDGLPGAGSTLMTLTDEGNVGIGTDSPNEILHIESSSPKIQLTDTSTNASSYIDADSGFGSISIMADHGNTSASSQINLMVDGSSKMVVKDTGNVGIGTTSPGYKLDVNGSTSNAALRVLSTDRYTGIRFEDSINNDTLFYDGQDDLMYLGSSNFKAIDLYATNKVGIGTTSPNNELEILGSNSPRISLRTSSETTGEALELGFQIGTGANASSNTVGLIKSVITQADPSSLIGDLEFQTNSGDSASTKMTIKGGGNVGIGTTNPTLTYGGKGLHIENSDTAGIMLNDTTGAKFNIAARSSDVLLYTNTDHRLRFGINGQERMRIETSGNVGIGTTSPGGKLDVAGDTDARVILGRAKFDNYVSDYLYLSHFDQGSATNYALNQSPAGSTSINAPTGQNVALKINNSAKLHIQGTTGNVGIGTTSPTEALHVVGTGVFTGDIGVGTTSILGGAANRGNITVNGSSDAALVFGNAGTLKGYILQDSSGMTAYSDDAIYFYAGGSERMRISSLGDTSVFGDFGIYTTHGTFDFGSVAGANDLDSETSLGAPEDLRISADNHIFRRDTAEHMRITSAGNVGIGTTSPSVALDVNAESGIKVQYLGDVVFEADPGTGNFKLGDVAQVGGSAYIASDLSTHIDFFGDGDVRFLNDGDVGIGTSNPSYKLDVVGTSGFSERLFFSKGVNTGSLTPAFYKSHTGFSLTNDSNYQKMVCYGYDANNNPIFQVAAKGFASDVTAAWDNDAATRFTVLAGGNVGIGTTSPGSPLHVAATGLDTSAGALGVHIGVHSSTYAGIEMVSAGSNSGWIDFLNVTDGGDYKERIRGGSGYFEFHTNSGERMRIDSSGNVGIGTTSPTHELVVQGTSSPNIELKNSNYSNGGFVLNRTNYTQQWKWWAESNQMYFGFATDESTYSNKMTIQSGGNVGIGTISPLTKLHLDFDTLTNGDINELVLQSKADGSTYYNNSAITGITFTNWVNGYTAGSLNRAAGIYGYNADTAERYGRYMGLSFYTSTLDADATEKMRIDHLGDVGIGITNPACKLHIGSTSGTVASTEEFRIQTATGSGFGGAAVINLVTGNYGVSGVYFGDNSTYSSQLAKIEYADLGGTLSYNSTTHYWRSSNDIKMTLLSSGNFGIGNTNPDATLTVYRPDTTYAINLSNTEARAGLSVRSSSTFDSKLTISSGASDRQYIQAVNNAATTGRDIVLNPYGGNVGIGTISPAEKLAVDGSIRIPRAEEFYWTDGSVNGSQRATIFTSNNEFGGDYNGLGFSIGANGRTAPSMYIRGTGNVGIGTTSPDSKLHIDEGDITISGFNTSRYIRFTEPDNSFQGAFINYDGSGNVFYIGTHDTDNALTSSDVRAISISRGSANVVVEGSVYSKGNNFVFGSSTSEGEYIQRSGNDIRFIAGGGTTMTIDGDAKNVGIGTTDPETRFHVVQNANVGGTAGNFEKLRTLQNSGGSGGNNVYVREWGYRTSAGTDWTTWSYHNGISVDISFGTPLFNTKTFWHREPAANKQYFGGGSNKVLTIEGGGGTNRVGINDDTPSYELDVTGTIRATGDVIAYSDIRVKENISTIENALDKVKKLRGVEYNKIDNPERSIGVIAQEIEEVIPQVVKEDNEGMKSVAYGNITAVLIEAIKEQQKQIDELKNQLDAFTK